MSQARGLLAQPVLVAIAAHVGGRAGDDQRKPRGPRRVIALEPLQRVDQPLDALLGRDPAEREQDEAGGIDLVASERGLAYRAANGT